MSSGPAGERCAALCHVSDYAETMCSPEFLPCCGECGVLFPSQADIDRVPMVTVVPKTTSHSKKRKERHG